MVVDKATAPSSLYQRRAYYFCMEEHQHSFTSRPTQYLAYTGA